jgi:hypothetical protein
MTDTPRTDAFYDAMIGNLDTSRQRDFARQLERELSEAKKLVSDFEREANAGFHRVAECEKQHGQKAVSDVAYVFRLLAEASKALAKMKGETP